MKIDNFSAWLDELGKKVPVPGGGAVAAVSAALTASTLKMVAEYTTGPKFAEYEEQSRKYADDLAKLSQNALDQAEQDSLAFSQVSAAYKLPSGSENEKVSRDDSIQKALISASQPPSEIVLICEKILIIADRLKDIANPNLVSDVAVAISSCEASLNSAIVNIEVNSKNINDPDIRKKLAEKIRTAEELVTKAKEIVEYSRKKITGGSN